MRVVTTIPRLISFINFMHRDLVLAGTISRPTTTLVERLTIVVLPLRLRCHCLRFVKVFDHDPHTFLMLISLSILLSEVEKGKLGEGHRREFEDLL